MQPQNPPPNVSISQFVTVRPEPPGQFTAQVVGLPELQATGGTRQEAIEQIRTRLREWLASGQLVALDLPQEDLVRQWSEWASSDPEYNLYLQEIRRFRQEEDERFQKEEDRHPCSPSSSTPTT